MSTTITLEDGRVFPVYEGKPLAWSLGLYDTINEERSGYPRLRAVIDAMAEHRPDQLEREIKDLRRGSFDKMFGHNARRALGLIEQHLARRGGKRRHAKKNGVRKVRRVAKRVKKAAKKSAAWLSKQVASLRAMMK